MKYNKENYEAFALDYLENNLSDEDRAEFEVFLLLNPDIQDSIRQFEWIEVPALVGVEFPNKKALLRDEGKGRIIFFRHKLISLAAAVLLLLMAVVFLLPKDAEPEIAIAETPIEMEPDIFDEKVADIVEEVATLPVQPTVQKPSAEIKPITSVKTLTRPKFVKDHGSALAVNDKLDAPETNVIETQIATQEVPLEELFKVDERVVYQVVRLEQKLAALPTNEYKLEEPDFPILVIDEEELLGKEPSKFKRFLARANLIPTDFTSENDDDSFKQNFLPESIPGLK